MFEFWGIEIKIENFIKCNYSMAKTEHQLRAEYSILPVWHTEWAFQRQTWEENVCSCTEQQRPQRVLFHQNTCSNDRGWTMKKMTQMADKDRPCSPLHSPPHTRLCFQFSELKRDGGSGERLLLGEGEETGRGKRGEEEGCRGGTRRTGKPWQPGEEQTGFKSNLQATGCWRGVGLGQGTVRQTLG